MTKRSNVRKRRRGPSIEGHCVQKNAGEKCKKRKWISTELFKTEIISDRKFICIHSVQSIVFVSPKEKRVYFTYQKRSSFYKSSAGSRYWYWKKIKRNKSKKKARKKKAVARLFFISSNTRILRKSFLEKFIKPRESCWVFFSVQSPYHGTRIIYWKWKKAGNREKKAFVEIV